jgi:hypothetical protein
MKRSHFIRVVSVHRGGHLVYGTGWRVVSVHRGGRLVYGTGLIEVSVHHEGRMVYGTGLGVRSCGEIAIFVTTDALWEIAASWKTTAT